MPATTGQTERVVTIDVLRGIASFAVCWFHLTYLNAALSDGVLKASGRHGNLGVDMFFVISGFVIPYTLYRNGYTLAGFWRFILKRIVRLDPPYLFSLAATLLLMGLAALASAHAPGLRGDPRQVSLVQVLLHLGYVNVFFGYPWLNGVYWSLAIEFQYYILIGCCFPLIVSRRTWVRAASFVFFCGLAVLYRCLFPRADPKVPDRFVIAYLGLFLAGIATFWLRSNLVGKRTFGALLCALLPAIWFTLGPLNAMVGLATALLIAFVTIRRGGVLLFMGSISYSLYLIHIDVGARLTNISGRMIHNQLALHLIVFVAAALSILAAWLMFRLIERPSQRWSSYLSYRQPAPSVPVAAASDRQAVISKQ